MNSKLKFSWLPAVIAIIAIFGLLAVVNILSTATYHDDESEILKKNIAYRTFVIRVENTDSTVYGIDRYMVLPGKYYLRTGDAPLIDVSSDENIRRIDSYVSNGHAQWIYQKDLRVRSVGTNRYGKVDAYILCFDGSNPLRVEYDLKILF